MPGSIGPKGPAHVFKGTKMAGRMGGNRITIPNLEIIEVDAENNLIYIKGAIPGAINSLILISGEGELKVNLKKEATPEATPEATSEVAKESEAEEVKAEVKKETEEIKTEEKKEEAKTEETKVETKEETKAEEVKTEANAS